MEWILSKTIVSFFLALSLHVQALGQLAPLRQKRKLRTKTAPSNTAIGPLTFNGGSELGTLLQLTRQGLWCGFALVTR
jgi:hypothetical protein